MLQDRASPAERQADVGGHAGSLDAQQGHVWMRWRWEQAVPLGLAWGIRQYSSVPSRPLSAPAFAVSHACFCPCLPLLPFADLPQLLSCAFCFSSAFLPLSLSLSLSLLPFLSLHLLVSPSLSVYLYLSVCLSPCLFLPLSLAFSVIVPAPLPPPACQGQFIASGSRE